MHHKANVSFTLEVCAIVTAFAPTPRPPTTRLAQQRIVLANLKGGVGKTITSYNLARALAPYGRVLLIGMDNQANLELMAGLGCERQPSMYDVLRGDPAERVPLVDVIVHLINEGIDIAPASIYMTSLTYELGRAHMAETLLGKAIDAMNRGMAIDGMVPYSFIIIDTHPDMEVLTASAMQTADAVVVPIYLEKWSIAGLRILLAWINEIRADNPRLKTVATFINQLDERKTQLNGRAMPELLAMGHDLLLRCAVHSRAAIETAKDEGRSIYAHARISGDGRESCAEYDVLAQQLLARMGVVLEEVRVGN